MSNLTARDPSQASASIDVGDEAHGSAVDPPALDDRPSNTPIRQVLEFLESPKMFPKESNLPCFDSTPLPLAPVPVVQVNIRPRLSAPRGRKSPPDHGRHATVHIAKPASDAIHLSCYQQP